MQNKVLLKQKAHKKQTNSRTILIFFKKKLEPWDLVPIVCWNVHGAITLESRLLFLKI